MVSVIKNLLIQIKYGLQVVKIHTDNKRTLSIVSTSIEQDKPFNLRDTVLDIKNTTFQFKAFYNSSIYTFRKYFKSTTELRHYLESMTNNDLIELKNEIFKCKLVPITKNNRTCYIDNREFLCVLEHRKFYEYERNKWNNLFKISNLNSFKRAQQLATTHEDLSTRMNSLEIYIFNFIRSNQTKKTIYFNFTMSIEELARETSKLIELIFDFQSPSDFKQYSNKISSPDGIVNLFNELSMKNSLNYKNKLNFNFYKEIHFHLLFLILVDLNSNVNSWTAEKECRRLNTLLSNYKITSSGFCDVFYKDNQNVSYIVEIKYYRKFNHQNKYDEFDNLDECKVYAIDQARSYHILSNEENIQYFAVVFHVNQKNNVITCDLVKDNDSNKQYERISNVKVLNSKYENEIHEITNIFKIMRNKEYDDLKNHTGNEFASIVFQNKTYFIDIEFFKNTKKEELYDENFWIQLFKNSSLVH